MKIRELVTPLVVVISILYLLSYYGLRFEIISGKQPEIILHTTVANNTSSSSSVGFDLNHAKAVGADIHAKGNGELKWQGETVHRRGGTLGAYTEVVNIFNGTDYTLREVYDVLVKDHPELITSGKEPYNCHDVNKHFGFSVETDKKCTISEVKDLLNQGKLVQKMVSQNKWRNSKGEWVSWEGSHTGLIFHYDGTFHMKAAGKIRQTDAIYTEKQLSEWMGGQEKKFIVYTKTSSQATSLTKKTSSVGPIDPIDLTLDEKTKQFQMKLNKVSQGCCFVGTNLIAVCDINVSTGGGNDNGTVCLYDRQTGERIESSAVERVGNHSNSMTFDPIEQKLLIATKGVDVYKVNLIEKKIEKEKSHLDLRGHGIAYDPKTDNFIMVSGKTIMKYTREEFYEGKSPSISHRYTYTPYNEGKASAQGLGAFESYGFIPFSNKDNNGNYINNTIVVVKAETGENLTELKTTYPHELEDCMFSDSGELFVSDTMGNLFDTGVNAYSDLKIGSSGGMQFLPKLPKLPNFFSFIPSIFKRGNNEKNTSNFSSMSREEKIEESVRWELAIAEDDSHGYSTDSDERYGQHGEYCCSTLSIMSWERLGVPVRSKYHASRSKDLYKAYLKAGFKDVTNQVNLKTMEGLQRGDVLLNKNHSHTETYIGDGKVVGAHKDSHHPERGDQRGDEISINSYFSHSYATVLRYYGN